MQLGKLYSKNIGGNREITIFGADLVELFGDNGVGKSSAWKGVMIALGGASACGELPLRRGAKKGESTVYLVYDEHADSFIPTEAEETADLIVTRSLTEKNQHTGGSLTIRGRDGAVWQKTQQTLLNQVYDGLAFSPPDIATRLPGEAKDKFDKRIAATFQELAGQDFCDKKATMDARLKKLETKRTDLGKALKKFGIIPDLPKVETVDTEKISADLARWEKHEEAVRIQENKVMAAEAGYKDTCKTASAAAQQVGRLGDELRRAQEDFDTLAAQETKEQGRLLFLRQVTIPEPEGLAPKDELMENLTQAGKMIAAAEEYKRAEERRLEKRETEAEHGKIDRAVEKEREDIQELIDAVDLGIPGLAWDSDMVALNKVPWSEVNTGQRWKSAIGMLITREELKQEKRKRQGLPPSRRFKMILIKAASLIDKRNFREIVEDANARGWQIGAESIMPHSSEAIEIVDGGVFERELDTDAEPEPADDLDGEL